MFTDFLITGATGFLGNTIAWLLHNAGCPCKALVTPQDPYESKLPPDTAVYYGDVTNAESIRSFVDKASNEACLVHCAGIVSIASKKNPIIHRVNVEGTRNILQSALHNNIEKVIYVSSIHAIPEKAKGEVITEPSVFDPSCVKGEYAQSKAEASQMALDAYRKGLNVSIVHPSGIIGPYDWRHGQITNTILSYCKGKLPAGVQGGNNFVDVRDVGSGVLACAEYGAPGECYILSGHCSSVKDILECVRNLIGGKKLKYLPLSVVKWIAPFYEKIALMCRKKPFLTPYSAYALGCNADYSYAKAEKVFGYHPRKLDDTISDMIKWLWDTAQI